MKINQEFKDKVNKFWNIIKLISFIILFTIMLHYIDMLIVTIDDDITIELFKKIIINIGFKNE